MEGALDSQESSRIAEVEDTFGLEFAAVQWLNLVTNAEELFSKLLHSILLSSEEKEQIRRWLCLKQECEECIASDEATSFDGHPRHSLERIEELTEDLSEPNGKSSDSQYESDSDSDFDYQRPDFEDKLYGYMECFKDKVDLVIRDKLKKDESVGDLVEVENTNQPPSFSQHFVPPNAHQTGRRKSLHPGCMPVPITLCEVSNKTENLEESDSNETSEEKKSNEMFLLENSYTLDAMESNKELKDLSLKTEGKKNQIKQIITDLEGAHKRLEELQHSVEIKERFIKDLIKNSDTKESAKIKFKKKYTKLEEEYYKVRSQIAHAEYALHEKKHSTVDYDFLIRQKSEIEKYKNLAKHYEKRLKDIGMIRQIAGDSAKTVLELENSVLKSKKEIDKHKDHIEKEESRKEKLEQEILEEEEKLKNLECSLQVSGQDTTKEGDKLDRFNLQLVLNAGSSDVSGDNVEALRKEIVNLRNTKDCLLEQRRSLDEKYRKNQTLSPMEKRRMLECDEGIEAIDATIEYKNEMMCGRKSMDAICFKTQELGEQMLMERLLLLSPDEMRTLLLKYFRKVIDLKESGRKMEQQIYELEHENESLSWRIQNLSHTLQTQRIEAELQKVALERSHEEKLHLMMRHFADESSSSGTEARGHLFQSKDDELSKVKRENKYLKKKLQEIQAAAAASRGLLRIRSGSTSPEPLPLKQLPAPPSTSTSSSKVTREKNKVIITLNAPKKKKYIYRRSGCKQCQRENKKPGRITRSPHHVN